MKQSTKTGDDVPSRGGKDAPASHQFVVQHTRMRPRGRRPHRDHTRGPHLGQRPLRETRAAYRSLQNFSWFLRSNLVPTAGKKGPTGRIYGDAADRTGSLETASSSLTNRVSIRNRCSRVVSPVRPCVFFGYIISSNCFPASWSFFTICTVCCT